MECERYSPLISRFLDDDLEQAEVDGFLEHLFACARCRQELETFEAVSQGFRKADLMDAPPEPSRPFSLEDLGAYAHEEAGAVPLTKAASEGMAGPVPTGSRTRRSRGVSWRGSLSRLLFPQNLLRYAAPMIVVLVVGIWIYPEGDPDRIDVRTIPPSQALSEHLAGPDAETEDMQLYVMDHATLQPWAHYGSHLPMIRRVAGSTP